MIVWGFSWPSSKYLTGFFEILELAFTRFVITLTSVFFILRFLKISLQIEKKGWIYLFFASVLMTSYSILFFKGIQHGMPGAGGVLVTTMTPIFTILVSLFFSKRWPNRKEIYGLLLGFLAATFLLHVWENIGNVFKLGNIYFLVSVFVWIFLSRITSNSRSYGSPLAFTWWIYVLCSFFLSFLVDFSSIRASLAQGNGLFYFNLFFNAIINTGIATTVFFFATSKLGPSKTSSFIYIVPFAAALSSYFFLGEIIQWYTIVGGLIGLLAVFVLNWKASN
jgi:drug/metabolite transporter (DMT)-like permease